MTRGGNSTARSQDRYNGAAAKAPGGGLAVVDAGWGGI